VSVHEKSQGYHSAAHDYVAGRPGYPPEAVKWLRDALGAAPGRKIVEVGAGTGKFIPMLQEVGCTIIAVEPTTEMREQLVQSSPSVSFIAGLAKVERRAVELEVRDLIDRTPELGGGREVAFPYETSMFAYRAI